MAIRDYVNKLKIFQHDYVLWLACIRSPLRTALNAVADPELSDHDKILRGTRIWAIGFLMSFFLSVPAYKFGGVAFESAFFFFSVLTTLLMAFSLTVLVIQAVLKMFGIHSNFADTFLIYAVIFGSYAPFLSLLGLPDLVLLLGRLKLAGQAQSIEAVLSELSRLSDASTHDPLVTLVALIGALSALCVLAMALVFAKAIASTCRVDLYRAISAVNCSITVFLPIIVGLTLGCLHLFVLYVFMA